MGLTEVCVIFTSSLVCMRAQCGNDKVIILGLWPIQTPLLILNGLKLC